MDVHENDLEEVVEAHNPELIGDGLLESEEGLSNNLLDLENPVVQLIEDPEENDSDREKEKDV
jgi:hypothetical protein